MLEMQMLNIISLNWCLVRVLKSFEVHILDNEYIFTPAVSAVNCLLLFQKWGKREANSIMTLHNFVHISVQEGFGFGLIFINVKNN